MLFCSHRFFLPVKIFLRSKVIRTLLAFSLFFILLFVLTPLPHPLFPPDYSTEVLDRNGKILRVFLNKKEQWCFAPDLRKPIPRKLETAVLFFEDKHFYRHPGVNPISILRALKQNARSEKVVSGASTLSMQVARLADPKSRTYLNKCLEILQAFKIEFGHSKRQILKLYLDHAPYGSNIIGFRAASLRYFEKEPDELTWAEAALLAVLPNAPGLMSPVSKPADVKDKRDRLLRRLFESRLLDRETYQLSLLESVPDASHAIPSCAFHLSLRLFQNKKKAAFIVRTTIDRAMQLNAERMAKAHLAGLSSRGIRNGSLLIAETATGKVRAYVGSQDPFDKFAGQVDGVIAPRSPGSILKPFLYALCMDQGLLLPDTRLRDVPTYYGAFSPANSDQGYDGLVRAKDALVRSLNVPAVRLLYLYGVDPFYLFLKSAGVATLFRTSGGYGLPLVLGGAEVTLWDAAALFRGLANRGCFEGLAVEEGEEESLRRQGKDLISPGAAYLVLSMLRELKRPGAEYYWEKYQNQWPFAWKTGTSYGQKDAWAIGVNPQWTIAAWVGNFDGEGNANLNGAACAGPLLFDAFNFLTKNPKQAWFGTAEDELQTVELCADTGYLFGPHCSRKVSVPAPRFMKPLKLCPYHREMILSADLRHQVCSLCWQTGRTVAVRRLVYPPDVVQYLREKGQVLETIPPHCPSCSSRQDNDWMEIVYPQENATLYIPREVDGRLQRIVLRVAHRRPESMLYWYLDDRYVGTTRIRHNQSVTLEKGHHRLEVVDDRGARSAAGFYAERK